MWLSKLFSKPAPRRDRAAALADFRDTLANAVAKAEAAGVHLIDVADALDDRAMAVRAHRVNTAPIF